MSFPAVQLHTCACCSRRTFSADAVHLKLDATLKSSLKALLQNPRIASALADVASQAIPGAIIADAGIHMGALEPFITLCKHCERYITQGKLPRFALANNLWQGPTTPDLPEPTLAEQFLFARERCKLCVITLTEVAGPGTGQRAFKPHCIFFPTDIAATTKLLPFAVGSLADCIKVRSKHGSKSLHQ